MAVPPDGKAAAGKLPWREMIARYGEDSKYVASIRDIRTLLQYCDEINESTMNLMTQMKVLDEKVNAIWYAPGMPGAKEARAHFESLNACNKEKTLN